MHLDIIYLQLFTFGDTIQISSSFRAAVSRASTQLNFLTHTLVAVAGHHDTVRLFVTRGRAAEAAEPTTHNRLARGAARSDTNTLFVGRFLS